MVRDEQLLCRQSDRSQGEDMNRYNESYSNGRPREARLKFHEVSKLSA